MWSRTAVSFTIIQTKLKSAFSNFFIHLCYDDWFTLLKAAVVVGKNIWNVSMTRFCPTFLCPNEKIPKNLGEIDKCSFHKYIVGSRISLEAMVVVHRFVFGPGRVSVVSIGQSSCGSPCCSSGKWILTVVVVRRLMKLRFQFKSLQASRS